MVKVPVLVPAAPGLKVTDMVQSAPASKVVPQVLVWEKSPLVVMLETGTGASPGLVSVTVWALLLVPTICTEKKSEEEDNFATGVMGVAAVLGDELAGVVGGTTGRRGPTLITEPVPLSAIMCGLPVALSKMLRVPVLVPGARGLKVTARAQIAPALTVVPQVLVWEKSPLTVMLEIASEALPALPSMTVRALLLVPTF